MKRLNKFLFLSIFWQLLIGGILGLYCYLFLGAQNTPQLILLIPFFFSQPLKIMYLVFIGFYFLFNTIFPSVYNITMKEHIFESICKS